MFAFGPLNLFGAVVVTIMMLAYAAEARGPLFTFIFAVSSAGASAYGWLSGTWPFGIIELVWAIVAFNKWRKLNVEHR